MNAFKYCIVSAYVTLFILEIFLSDYSIRIGEDQLNYGLMLFLMHVLYTLASLKIIGPTELGARLFFGRPVCSLKSGLVFIPLGICQLKIETRLVIAAELPANPEKIFRTKEGESEINIPPGMFPPIRIPFGYPKKTSADPLDNRITAEIVPFIRWHITDYLQFLVTIGSIKEAIDQMEDAAVTRLLEEFAKVTPAVALKNLGKYNKILKNTMGGRVEGWGIEIDDAEIKSINFSRKLNDAILGIPEADLKKSAKILEAQGEKEKLELEGQGQGLAEKAALAGRGEGLKKMASILEVTPEAILNAETARAVTEGTEKNTIIAGAPGIREIMTLATAIKE